MSRAMWKCSGCGRLFHEGNRHTFSMGGRDFSCEEMQRARRVTPPNGITYIVGEDTALELLVEAGEGRPTPDRETP